ncbi:hypothetical protein CFP56_035012 [Quercus suber]|uniref:Uncharacterized protein n=1 Tax=Quercus suber TaxID=58331 RepID=A0AAW0JAZ1_QUESU
MSFSLPNHLSQKIKATPLPITTASVDRILVLQHKSRGLATSQLCFESKFHIGHKLGYLISIWCMEFMASAKQSSVWK